MSVGTTLDIPVATGPAWRDAVLVDSRALVEDIREATLVVDGWPGHSAGQYLDVRFPVDGGWSRTHSFSIAAPPEDGARDSARIRIAARQDLLEGLAIGTELRVDGPKGARLAWTPEDTGDRPLLLVAGGTGIVPLLAIASVWSREPRAGRLQLIHSVRSLDRQAYSDELHALAALPGAGVTTVVTGEGQRTPTPMRGVGRLGALDLELFGVPAAEDPECFVCGPTPFVESVTRMLIQARYPAVRIRTEWAVSLEEGS